MFRLIVKWEGKTTIDVNLANREYVDQLKKRYEETGYTVEVIEE